MTDVKDVVTIEIELVTRKIIHVNHADMIKDGGSYIDGVNRLLAKVKQDPKQLDKFTTLSRDSFNGSWKSLDVVDVSEVEDETVYDGNLEKITDLY